MDDVIDPVDMFDAQGKLKKMSPSTRHKFRHCLDAYHDYVVKSDYLDNDMEEFLTDYFNSFYAGAAMGEE